MKLAIQDAPGFGEYWVKYCREKSIDFKTVNFYNNNIIQDVSDCDAVMFDLNLSDKSSMIFGKEFVFALESINKKVFPDFHTMWHYDDKLGQKYLFEAIKAPLVPTYVFYEKQKALDWANTTKFPKVFKLRNGAGSSNVRMVKNKKDAFLLINQAFDKGFYHQRNPWEYLSEKWRLYQVDRKNFGGVKAAIKRLFFIPKEERKLGLEYGYVYFQDFIPNNSCDFRLQIVDGKCWAMRRMVRKGDFRASGSGVLDFNPEKIPMEMVKLAFDLTQKLKMKMVGFDFVLDENNNPLVVEMSYTFGIADGELSFGYWDESLQFHKGLFNPFGWMVDSVLK